MLFDFLLAALVTWRLAHMLTREEGPYDVFVRCRSWAGESVVGRALQCFYCTSLWVAAPLAFFVVAWSARAAVVWVALSGAACLLDRATQRGLEVLPIDNLPPTGGG